MFSVLLLTLALTAHCAPLIDERLHSDLDVNEFKEAMKELGSEVMQEYSAPENMEETKDYPVNPSQIDEIEEVNKKAGLEDELFEGDIAFSEEQLKEIEEAPTAAAKRQAVVNGGVAWGRTPIPFFFRNSTTEINNLFRKATKFWESKTCVRFQENGAGANKINVYNAGGCWSNVGKQSGENSISLEPGCGTLSTVTHEIEHALGFFHEQSRSDRDNYVTFKSGNVMPTAASNFNKEVTNNLQVPYEYGSNMHYVAGAFSKNQQDTLVARDPRYQNSMRGHMPSFYDVMKVNKFYGCDQNCRGRPISCQNNGVQDVNDCTKCLCPEGFGGRYCEGKPDVKCVVELKATSAQQTYNFQQSTPSDPDTPEYCFYIITAPPNQRVQLAFTYFGSGMATGCNTSGMEVKTMVDHRPRGFQSCGFKPNDTYTSERNRITIMAWKRKDQFVAGNFNYRAI